MTTRREQASAVFFSVLMVVSMVAGSVAFGGLAAADGSDVAPGDNAGPGQLFDTETASGENATAQTGASFEVSNAGDLTVDNGTEIALSADVENGGNESRTQPVSLSIDGAEIRQTDLNLSAGESETVTFQGVETGTRGPGDYTYTIASPGDSASGSLTVQSTESGDESGGGDGGGSGGDDSDTTAEFQVSNAADRTVDNGTRIDLSADVDNVGNGSGTQTVSLLIDDSETNQTSLTLSAGGNDTVSFQGVDTAVYGSGDHTYTIVSTNDSAGGSLTVQSTESGDGGDDGDSSGDGSGTTTDVNQSASSVTPTAAETNESRTYSVTVRVDDTSLANDTGEVDVRFEDFALDAAGNGTDLTIEYTADDVTDSTLTVSESVNATAPATNGTRDVDVTDLRRDTSGDGTGFLIEDANVTIGTIVVSENETSDGTVTETTTITSDAVGTQQVDVDPSDLEGNGEDEPYEISNASELQAMEDDLDANYELVTDITANTSSWNGGSGFDPIGKSFEQRFAGSLDGNGHTITGLYIDRPDTRYIGLFASISSEADISDVSLTEFTIVGSGNVGGLTGDTEGTILNATVSGSVNSTSQGTNSDTGGLVGENADPGSITNVTASSITIESADKGGGLVGQNLGEIQDANATGTVTGDIRLGGLVGENLGTINNATATSSVNATGAGIVGGLVGRNGGTVTDATASGKVTSDGSEVGGLVGNNRNGIITDATASGDVAGSEGLVGGLIGLNDDGQVTNAAAFGSVTVKNGDTVGGLIGSNVNGAVQEAFAVGSVSGNDPVGGLVGENDTINSDPGTVEDSYWNNETTGQSTSDGNATGLTTSQMTGEAARSNMSGLTYGEIWEIRQNDYPALIENPEGPTANDDEYTISEDETLNISSPGVLSNDTDPDNDTLTAVLVSGPSNGDVTLNANGNFEYTPDANFAGTDSFTYNASDGTLSGTGTVTINVTGVNDPPTAVNENYSTPDGTTLDVSPRGVLENDSDPDDVLNATRLSGPTNGTLTLNEDGSFEYAPNQSFIGTDSFTYNATDGELNDTATVTITVIAVNEPPTAVNDSYDAAEDTTLTVSSPGVLDNDTDPDPNDVLNATIVSDPANGNVTLNPNGSFGYTPDADFAGTDSFRYNATDGDLSDTGTVTITVSEVNDPPTAVNDSYSTEDGTVLNVSAPGILENDPDPDGDTLNAARVSGPTNGTLTLDANGSFDYTPGPDFIGTDSFTYNATDGELNDTATVTIDVTDDTVPVLTDATAQSSNGDQTVRDGETVVVSVNASDVEGSDISSVTADASDLGAGTVSLSETNIKGVYNGSFTVNASEVSDGRVFPDITATDEAGNQDTTRPTIGVLLDTTPPEADIDANRTTVQPGGSVEFNVSGSSDPGDSSSGLNRYNITANGSQIGEGGFDIDETVTNQFESSGTYTVELTASDFAGNTDTETETITVGTGNAAPTGEFVVEPGDWSMPNGDAAKTSYNPESDDPRNITRDWEVNDTAVVRPYVVSQPVIVNDTVYVVGFSGNVTAVDAATGSVLWTEPVLTDGGNEAYLAVHNGTGYAANRSHVTAFDPSDGSVDWRYDDLAGGKVRDLTVANETVLFGLEDPGVAYALDADTGTQSWSYTSPTRTSGIAVKNGTAFVSGDNADDSNGVATWIAGVAIDNGTVLWSDEISSADPDVKYDSEEPPVVSNGSVHLPVEKTVERGLSSDAYGYVYVYDTTGGLTWTANYTSPARWTPKIAVADGTVYANTNADDRMFALDTGTQSVPWNTSEFDVGASEGNRGTPVVANETVYVGDSTGDIHAFDAGSGSQVFTEYTGWNGPTKVSIADGTLYVTDGSGDLQAWSAATTDETDAPAPPEVNVTASSVSPTSVTSGTQETFEVAVGIDNTSLGDTASGDVTVAFEGFNLSIDDDELAGPEEELRIDYTDANVSNGAISVTETVSATTPSIAGPYPVNVTDVEVATTSDTDEFLIEDELVTIDTIEVTDGSDDGAGLPENGTEDDPYRIANASELQAMEDDLNGNYVLVADIDASDTAQWNNGSGFDPVGGTLFNNDLPWFRGTLDGNGHTITGLTIDRPSEDFVGIFRTSAGTVSNVSLTNVTVTGNSRTGVVAAANPGDISDTNVSGNVTGDRYAGGVVGDNPGSITNATASVTVSGGQDVGGLVGGSDGTITAATASGSVNGTGVVGGLTGSNQGVISDANASGSVTGSEFGDIGGLVGRNAGTITAATASGNVTGIGDSGNSVGGLVGGNTGTITNTAASGRVSGSSNVGGLVGKNDGGGNRDGGTIRESFAVGLVSGENGVGGLAGSNIAYDETTGSIFESYFDSRTTNQPPSENVTSLTTDQMQGEDARTNMTGLDFETTWRVTDGYPALRAFSETAPGEGPPDAGTALTVNASASSVSPTRAAVGYSQTYTVTVTVENTSLNDSEARNIEVRFEDFEFDTGEEDLTIGYSAADVTDGTVTVSETVPATPVSTGLHDVTVTDIRREASDEETGSLLEDANVTIDTIEVINVPDAPPETEGISFLPAGGSSNFGQNGSRVYSEKIVVATPSSGGVTIGDASSRAFRVVQTDTDTNESVVVEPEPGVGTYNITGAAFEIYRPNGTIGYSDPLADRGPTLRIRLADGSTTEIPVTVSGNRDLFDPSRTGSSVFDPYAVQLLSENTTQPSDSSVLTETGSRIRGIGYDGGPGTERGLRQNSTDGTIEVSIDRESDVNSSWHVEYVVASSPDSVILNRSVDNDNAANNFTATFDSGGLQNGSYLHGFIIRPSEGSDEQFLTLANENLQIGDGEGDSPDQPETQEAVFTLPAQATDSSTLNTSLGDETDPAVVATDVTSNVDGSIVVVYEVYRGADRIAGVKETTATETNGDPVTVPLENTTGLPGPHYAVFLNESTVNSTNPSPGDILSVQAEEEALATRPSLESGSFYQAVYEGDVDIADQQFTGSTAEITINQSALQPDAPSGYVVVLHDQSSAPVGAPIGTSQVLNGTRTNFSVTLDEEVEINTTQEVTAMLHFAANGSPGRAIPNADVDNGFVAGNVADSATINIAETGTPGGGAPPVVSEPIDNDNEANFTGTDFVERISFDAQGVGGQPVNVTERSVPNASISDVVQEKFVGANDDVAGFTPAASIGVRDAPSLGDGETATISGSVNASDVEDPSALTVVRVPDDQSSAERLPTNVTNLSDGTISFEATTTNFSTFVVGEEEASTANVTGSLTAASEASLENDTVFVYRETAGGVERYNNTVDADGNFSVAVNSTDATYTLAFGDTNDSASANGVPDLYAIEEVTPSADVGKVTVPEAYNVTVRVTDGDDGAIEGADVAVGHKNGNATIEDGARNATNASGYLTGNGENPLELVGNVTVFAGYDRFTNETQVRVTEDEPVNITLARNVSVSGRVEYANSDPAAGYTMELFGPGDSGDYVVTNESGVFELNPEPDRTYSLGFKQTDFDGSAEDFPKDGRPDLHAFGGIDVDNADRTVGDRTLPPAHLVNVTVEDTDGNAVSGANVDVNALEGLYGAHHPATTRGDGEVVLNGSSAPGVEVNGTLRVGVEATDDYAQNVTEFEVDGDRDVTVVVGDRVDVTGRLVNESGADLSGYNVLVGQQERTFSFDAVNERGRFAVPVGANRSYSVTVGQSTETLAPRDGLTDFYQVTTVAVNDGDEDVGEQTVPPAEGVLDVRVTNESGEPVENAPVVVVPTQAGTSAPSAAGLTSTTDAQGYFGVGGQTGIEASGNYTIRVERPSGDDRFVDETYTRTVTVTTGRTVEVPLNETAGGGSGGGGGGGGGGGDGSGDGGGGDGSGGGGGSDGDTGSPSFAVSGLDPQTPSITAGDTLTINATIENVGNATGTQPVEYRIGGTTSASKEVTLSPGENTTVEFADIETTNLVAGDYEHGAFTENASQTGTLTVEADSGGGTDDSAPGFGSVVSLLALVLFALITRRKRK